MDQVQFIEQNCYQDTFQILNEFKSFGKKELEVYLKSQDVFDSTAAVKYESKQFQQLVNQIITEDEEAIIGLPMIWLMKQLKKLELNKI